MYGQSTAKRLLLALVVPEGSGRIGGVMCKCLAWLQYIWQPVRIRAWLLLEFLRCFYASRALEQRSSLLGVLCACMDALAGRWFYGVGGRNEMMQCQFPVNSLC